MPNLWLKDQVDAYGARQHHYEQYAEDIQRVLSSAARGMRMIAIVQARHKAIASFAEKCVRKRAKYNDPVNQLTDLCGARVIVDTRAEVEQVCDFIKQNFRIDDANSEDVGDRLATGEFGYRSVHYIVQVPPPPAELANDFADAIHQQQYKAEVQVRTVVQHAWASVGHDRVYKSSFQVPNQYLRELARIAALLENVDDTFQRVVDSVDKYRLHYDAYMSPDEMAHELEIARAVFEHDDLNPELAQRIASLHGLLGQWDDVVRFCDADYHGPVTPRLKSIWGRALERLPSGGPSGRRLLNEAADEGDLEAQTELGSIKLSEHDRSAYDLYERAFEARPTDPRALGGYLECCIRQSHDLAMVPPLRPYLEEAVRICRDQSTVGVNIPEAMYRAGQFLLLLSRPYEALNEILRAITRTDKEETLDAAIESFDRIADTTREFVEAGWAKRLLHLAKRAKFHQCQPDETLKSWATGGAGTLEAPVVILAGGCDASAEDQVAGYRDCLMEAFEAYPGTLISGGTNAGICGIGGEIAHTYRKRLNAFCYMPKQSLTSLTKASGYHYRRESDGEGFSALEPLQNWIDLFVEGITADQVTVLGVNGGLIAGFEYRLALALGGRVGVIRDSGREAGRMFKEFGRRPPRNLAFLPHDTHTIQSFLEVGRSQSLISETRRVSLAQHRHEQYREEQRTRHAPQDPTMHDWDDLPEWVRRSNLGQIDHIAFKLEKVNMRATPVEDHDSIDLIKFTDEEIEKLAEMEHARWNVERLSDGWTFGERNPDERTNPFLVGWSDLGDEVKQWDRQAILAIPTLLKTVGLEIQRLPATPEETEEV